MKKHKKVTKKGIIEVPARCPYCGGRVELRSADGIYHENAHNAMLYVCTNYPECDAYIRVLPGTTIPVGTMANRQLRSLRRQAHESFDLLHKNGIMTKEDAYCWLAGMLGAPLSQAHIGYLGDYYCKTVIEESQKLLQKQAPRRVICQQEKGGAA